MFLILIFKTIFLSTIVFINLHHRQNKMNYISRLAMCQTPWTDNWSCLRWIYLRHKVRIKLSIQEDLLVFTDNNFFKSNNGEVIAETGFVILWLVWSFTVAQPSNRSLALLLLLTFHSHHAFDRTFNLRSVVISCHTILHN